MKRGIGFGAIAICLFIFLLSAAAPAAAAEKSDAGPKPERLLVLAPEYPGIISTPGKEVSMDLNLINRGRTDELVDLKVTQTPPGWKAKIKTYRYTVTGVHVPADDKRSLTFEAVPDKETGPGDYAFLLEAVTRDGRFRLSQKIVITLQGDQDAKDKDTGVKLTTSYPVIRGPSDATFEFSVEVDSRLDKEAVFDLFGQGPKGWEVNFKPSYETKFISSLRLKANQSQSIAVQVKPAPNQPAGEYPIAVRVASGDAKAEANLTVVLTGTYEIEAGTTSGLLSLEARPGTAANVSFYVKNTGSAPNTNIRFMTFKPENWKVEFKPEKIDVIEPGQLKQVEMIITPYEEALVGDYSVAVKIDGEKTSRNLEFRVSVKASAAWAWVGIAIIVAVIAGLLFLFRKLGRR
ncbi:MAG: NEW3 domain-containing protein [Desulfobacterales bacterium]